MHDFLKHFVRDPQGAWHCVEAAEMELPRGRIQIPPGARFSPGTEFMGVDVAKLLDEQLELDQQR